MTRKSDDLTRALRGLAPPRSERAARAAADLFTTTAIGRDLADVAVWTTSSPVGDLLLAVTPRGLLLIGYPEESRDATLELLTQRVSPRILEAAGPSDEVRRELDEYFSGERTRFDLKLDRRLVRGMAREVLAAADKIPFGATLTYGELAAKIGRPKAARAVGNALGSNPIPIVIPCHRVLRAGGTLGGYTGGTSRKERLLSIEGVRLRGQPHRRT